MKYLLIITTLLFSAGITCGQSGTENNYKKNKVSQRIEAQKIAFFTKILDLTPSESEKFWPLYNEYSDKERSLRANFNKNKPGKGMSEKEADDVINFYFDNEQQKLSLKKNYYDKFKMILPSTKVVKLHFAENKFKRKLLKKIKNRKKRKRIN